MKTFIFAFMACAAAFAVRAETDVEVGVYRVNPSIEALPLSRLALPKDDNGIIGAELGLEDNQTTGAFMGQNYSIRSFNGDDEEVRQAVADDYAKGERLFVLNAKAETLTSLADQFPDGLFFNTSSGNVGLRNENCRANLLHIEPSYAQRTDALIQYLMWKKWADIYLIYGSHDIDLELAESYRHSIEKFGAKLVGEKEFTDTGGARQTDTGIALVQKQIPLFTQNATKQDVIIAADESEVFAGYLPYRTWSPSPVMGSAGLLPVTWTSALDSWGAEQMQGRFEKKASRLMTETDYQYWLAMRVIGEAVTRTNSNDASVLRDYILSDDFEIAAFRGLALSFRNWNGQMRQPILLSDGNLTVSVSPQEGYLHQFSELDTLGYDESESTCQAFR